MKLHYCFKLFFLYHFKYTHTRLKAKATLPSNSLTPVHSLAFNCHCIDTALQEINELPPLKDELIKDEQGSWDCVQFAFRLINEKRSLS